MKTLPRLFVTLVTVLFIIALQIVPVKADTQQPNLTDAEEYVKNELVTTGDADLASPAFVAQFPNPKDQILSGDFVAGLFTDPDLQEKPFIKIHNAIISGNINADGVSIPFNVEFHHCTFEGRINLDSASVKNFTIDENSDVKGSVRMGRIKVEGDLALYQSTFETEVTLFDANISNNLFAAESKFLGATPDPDSGYPFELWKTQVGETTEFTSAVLIGQVMADDAKFGVDVKFDGVTFEKPASFMNIHVGNLADFQKAHFKDTVTFESSIMDRDIEFGGAAFDGSANFDYLSVARFFDFNKTVVNKDFSFQYSTIGWPNFKEAVFHGPVNFEGLQADSDFDFTNAAYDYKEAPFKVYLAKVDGRMLLDGFVSSAGLDLSNNQFGDLEILGNEKPTFAEIDLSSTVVNGDLVLDNLEVTDMSTEGLEVQAKSTFTRLAIRGNLNMSNAQLGFFTMSSDGFWPVPVNKVSNFNLRGMVYNDIGLVEVSTTRPNPDKPAVTEFVNKELEDNTWGVLSNMTAQSEYSPQAYRALEQFLTDKGHPDWAAQVEVDRKIRERDEILTPRSGLWLWSWFSYLFSGYGQIPALALVWSALVVIIGAVLYWRESDLVILDQSEAKPDYNPFFYSFAVFVPFIELDFAEKWDPNPRRKVAWVYKYVLKILGWILTPIALLTFGGVIT